MACGREACLLGRHRHGAFFRYDPAAKKHEQCIEGGEALGGFTIQKDGSLLLFMARGAVKVWRDGFKKTIIERSR